LTNIYVASLRILFGVLFIAHPGYKRKLTNKKRQQELAMLEIASRRNRGVGSARATV